MMEITQALEVPCRGGSIVITPTRVQRKGRPTWSIWRSLVGGVGAASAPSGLSLWLQLKDGRRLPIPGVTPAAALRLITILGYAASDLPAVPQFIQPHSQLMTPWRGGTLRITHDLMTLEGTSSWNLPRTAVAGVSVATVSDSATLLISLRNGQIVPVDGVPFEQALKVIAIVGCLPASFPPLPEMGPPVALPDRVRRTPARKPSHHPIVVPERSRPVAPLGGRLVPVLTPMLFMRDMRINPSAHSRVPGPSPVLETPTDSAVMPGRARADTIPGADGSKAPASSVFPGLLPPAPPFASSPEPPRLPVEAFFWEEEEEDESGFLRLLSERLRLPAMPALPQLHRPQLHRPQLHRPQLHRPQLHRPQWLQLPTWRRRAAPPNGWLRPPGPYEQRPGDWQRSPASPAVYARPDEWVRSSPRPSRWRRPAWLRRPQLRRHEALLPQVRPREWQREPARVALFVRPLEWGHHPARTQLEVRPAEWQRRSASLHSALRAPVWSIPLARSVAIAAMLLVVLALLLLIPASAPQSHVSARVVRTGGPPVTQTALRVFVDSQDGAIYVLDAHTGALVWRYQIGAKVESAPAVAGGVVYVGSDDHTIYALHPATKTVLWRYTTGGPVASALTVTGGIVYAGSYDGSLYALRASNGALLWRYQTGNWISAQPAVANGIIYVGSYDDDVYALRAADGTLLWRYHTQGIVASSPTVVGGIVYVGSADDDVYALGARNGTLLWRAATGGSVYSSPALANGTLYVGSADTHVYALRAADGSVLWRAATSGLVFSSPAVANGSVYVGSSDGFLYALRAADGSVLWRYQTSAAVVAPPAVAHGIVYAGSADGSVYALTARTGSLVWSYPTWGRVTWRVAVGG
jgi:outer membrane protein assembly factor BamB